MIVVLVKTVHLSNALVVLLADVRLQDIQVPHGSPVVPGVGGEGLCPQEVADHHHDWSVVISPDQVFDISVNAIFRKKIKKGKENRKEKRVE
jgi:hypothetical protein